MSLKPSQALTLALLLPLAAACQDHGKTKAEMIAAEAAAAAAHADDPDRAVAGTGQLPAGWQARADRDAPLTQLQFLAAGDTLRAATGPSAIVWRPADSVTGPVRLVATFVESPAERHPEGYGLLLGGSDLSGPAQQYTYFLIRQDGKFLIKRRQGAATTTVTDWTSHPAIAKMTPAGATNELSVSVGADAVSFMVNGTEVHRAAPAEVDRVGRVGLRINHNLDLAILGYGVHPM